MTPTRVRSITVLGALGGAGLVLVGLGRPWIAASVWTVTGETTVRATGRTLVPAVAAVALVAAAAAAVILFLGPRGRRAIGGVLVLAGVAAGALLLGPVVDPGAALAPVIAESTSVVGNPEAGRGRMNLGSARPRLGGWIGISAVGAGLILVSGLAVLARGRSWPGPRAGAATGTRTDPTGPAGSGPGPDDRRDLWDRLNRGEDPTA